MTNRKYGPTADVLKRSNLRIFPGTLSSRLVIEVASSARMPEGANAYLNVWMKGDLPENWSLPRGLAFKENLLRDAQEDLTSGLTNITWGQTLIVAEGEGTKCPRLLTLSGERRKVLVCLGQSGFQACLESQFGDAHILPTDKARAELSRIAPPHIYNGVDVMKAIVNTRGPPMGEEFDFNEERKCWKRVSALLNSSDQTGFMVRMTQGPSTDALMKLVSLRCLVMVLEGGHLEDEELLKASPEVRYCVLPAKAEHIVYMLGDVLWGGQGPIPGQNGHSYRISLRAMSHPSVKLLIPDPITGLLRFRDETTFNDTVCYDVTTEKEPGLADGSGTESETDSEVSDSG